MDPERTMHVRAGQTLRAHSPNGSNFLHEMSHGHIVISKNQIAAIDAHLLE